MTARPHHGFPGSSAPRRAEDLYAAPPPWDIGRPQPALQDLADAGLVRGRVLDAGCGTGEHTLMAAALGLDATGIDLATNALRTARQKARERGSTARFLCHDARRAAELGETFDTVLDCGLFHLFAEAERAEDRAAYVGAVHSVLVPGGRFFLLGFSDAEPDDWPHKLRRDDVTGAFTDGWRIDSVEPATIEARVGRGHVRAWRASLTRP